MRGAGLFLTFRPVERGDQLRPRRHIQIRQVVHLVRVGRWQLFPLDFLRYFLGFVPIGARLILSLGLAAARPAATARRSPLSSTGSASGGAAVSASASATGAAGRASPSPSGGAALPPRARPWTLGPGGGDAIGRAGQTPRHPSPPQPVPRPPAPPRLRPEPPREQRPPLPVRRSPPRPLPPAGPAGGSAATPAGRRRLLRRRYRRRIQRAP